MCAQRLPPTAKDVPYDTKATSCRRKIMETAGLSFEEVSADLSLAEQAPKLLDSSAFVPTTSFRQYRR
jgi:hypothetical protein